MQVFSRTKSYGCYKIAQYFWITFIVISAMLVWSNAKCVAAAKPQHYLIDWLEKPADCDTVPRYISSGGTVVGDSNIATSVPIHHAVLWINNKITDLSPVPTPIYSEANCINSHGLIVGLLSDTSRTNLYPCVWYHVKQHFVPTGPYPVGNILAINNHGQMCGYGNGCCVWINNVPRDLCGPNDDGGQATSINDSGQVAGEMHKKRKGRSYLPNYAFLWANGKLTNIDTQHSAGGSGATCINGSGEIAGYFIDSYNTRHAFYYTSKKGMCPLPSLADLDSVANSVNCSGTIVGYSATKDSPYHACLWFKGQAFDLNTLTSALDEWILLGGASINDRGQIACLAEKNGRRRAIVLIPLD